MDTCYTCYIDGNFNRKYAVYLPVNEIFISTPNKKNTLVDKIDEMLKFDETINFLPRDLQAKGLHSKNYFLKRIWWI